MRARKTIETGSFSSSFYDDDWYKKDLKSFLKSLKMNKSIRSERNADTNTIVYYKVISGLKQAIHN